MKTIPRSFQNFFIFITFVASVVLVWAILRTEWNIIAIFHLLVFGTLAVASESLPVALPNGGYVTVSFAVFLSAAVLFPEGIALSVAAVGALLVLGKAGVDQPLYKRAFNAAQFVLSLKAASIIPEIANIAVFEFNFENIFIYLLAGMAFSITNMTIVSLALGKILNKSPWSIWLGNIRWSIPNFLALAPLGLLIALTYKNYGPLGLILLSIPLLLSRHSFQLYMDMRENYLSTVEALVQALEAKDAYTSGHSGRVAGLAVAMAEKLKLSEDKIEFIKYAAVLHDIGKIGVSESILNKNGKLVDTEWEIIRNHPVIGYNIIKKIKFLFDIGNIVKHHHERYDGKGYPDGLRGEEIPLESRIIAVADTYDAITSDRSYRKGKTPIEALQELRKAAGSQLDPQLVDIFTQIAPCEITDESGSHQTPAKLAAPKAVNEV